MVEAGGVEPLRLVENTQVIENARRTSRKKRRKSSSDVHGMYAEFSKSEYRKTGGIALSS